MIQLIRIDDRLLHGQVAYSWKAYLGYDAIVIISEDVVKDEIRKMAIKIAKPEGVRLAIRGIKEGVELLNNDKLKALKVFAVTDDIKTASQIFESLNEKTKLNIGGLSKKADKEPYTSFAYLSIEDKKYLKKMKDNGVEIEFRLVPNDKPKYFTD